MTPNSESPELLPCPFCGASAKLTVADSKSRSPAMIGCSSCRAWVGQWVREEDAIAAWNTRPNPAIGGEDVEELRAALEKIELQSTNHGGWFEQNPFSEYAKMGAIARAALASKEPQP